MARLKDKVIIAHYNRNYT